MRLCKLTTPGDYEAIAAVLILFPQTPLLFQGQEFASSKPFYYFADRRDKDGCSVIDQGRKKELSQFINLATDEMLSAMKHPCDKDTFTASKLDLSEREKHHEIYNLYKRPDPHQEK